MVLQALKQLSAQVCYETFEGRRHLVAPVVLLVEGVHTGLSGRALYYPAEELSHFPAAWNGRPVPILHPTAQDEDGKIIAVSANSPEILEAESVGQIFNAWWDETEKKLKAEVWIDEGRARRKAPGLLEKLSKGEPVEVSTGFFHDTEELGGVWNGEIYEAIARNHRPDHLALLPGGVGACSWQDGCGVRANQGGEAMSEKQGAMLPKSQDNSDRPARPDAEVGKIRGLLQWLARLTGKKAEELAVVAGIEANEEMSHGETWGKLQDIINRMDHYDMTHYVRDVFDRYFVYEMIPWDASHPRKMMWQNYKMDKDHNITLEGEPEEVREKKEYVPVKANESLEEHKEEPDMDKTAAVTALIANQGNRFAEADKPWLLALSEDQLAKMAPEEKKTEALAVNCETCNKKATPKANTVGEYVAQAPREIQGVLNRALKHEEERKGELIAGIMANERNKFTQEGLAAKDVDELEALAALAGANYREEAATAGFNYAGQGGYQVNLGYDGANVPILD